MKIAVDFQFGLRMTALTTCVTYACPLETRLGGCSLTWLLGTSHETAGSRPRRAARKKCEIGAMALNGRDKLTLITPAPLDTLGLWVEQLIAESTGKEGKGVVPVAGLVGFQQRLLDDPQHAVWRHDGDVENRRERAPLEPWNTGARR